MSADKSTPSVPASECSSSTIEQENRCTAPTKTIQRDRDEHHDAAKKPDVFERNYQFARIYQDRRRALTAKIEANETGQRCFKAQPIRIVEFREAEKKLKFTVPTTPEVMKHNFNKRLEKE